MSNDIEIHLAGHGGFKIVLEIVHKTCKMRLSRVKLLGWLGFRQRHFLYNGNQARQGGLELSHEIIGQPEGN